MATDSTYRITPLALWAAGIACALVSFIGITGLVKLDKVQDSQTDAAKQLTAIAISQKYDGDAILALKIDVKAVQGEVRQISDRLGKVEARK